MPSRTTRTGAPALLLALGLVVAPVSVSATTIIPPLHLGDLAIQCDAVLLARAGASDVVGRGSYIFTNTEFTAVDVVHGNVRVGDGLVVQAPGGELDGVTWEVDGSPRFAPGERYLLMLQHRENDVWIPTMLAFGLLRETRGLGGVDLLEPIDRHLAAAALPRLDGQLAEEIRTYRAGELLAHLAAVCQGHDGWDASLVEADPAEVIAPDLPGGGAAPPSACSYFSSQGRNFRWRAFDDGGTATIFADENGDRSLPGVFGVVNDAMNKWMDFSANGMNLVLGGSTPLTIDCGGGQDSQGNTIVFNDPCNDIGNLNGCSGVLAYGGPRGQGSHTFDGATWLTISGWIVVVNNGVGCLGAENYRRMIAHELGHGLGWGHVDDGGALMFANCCNNPNGTDRSCARYTYPPVDPSNGRPDVDAGGNRTVVLVGNTARLVGTATDDGLPAGGELETTWVSLAGPAAASFSAPNELETTVSFPISGEYVLGLRAYDGELIRTDVVEVDATVGVGNQTSLSFQQGVAGYTGTVDTFLAEASPGATNANADEINVDSDDPSGSGDDVHALLRFDDLFGGSPRQIPPGATIRSAFLEFETTNPGDGASFHRMTVEWEEADSWSDLGNGIQRGTETVSVADALVTGLDGALRVDVTSSVAAWSADPCVNFGWALLPRGTDGWDFFSSEGDNPPRLVVDYVLSPEERIVAIGDTWDFLRGTSAPPADWNEVGFTPGASWSRGDTGIGFGDGDDATVIQGMQGSYVSLFLRREFNVTNPDAIRSLLLRVDYDDGFVGYLNGVEFARSVSMGAPGSPVSHTTTASSREAGIFEQFRAPVELLRPGRNVLAASVHNSAIQSSDLSFLPELLTSSVIVEGGSEWAFRRGSETIPASWNEVDFDDSGWEVGPTGIGYGDGDDVTELLDMEDGYVSVFCRRTFEIDDPDTFDDYRLTLIYDDGVVVYVNGVEVGRLNMPGGAVGRTTTASSSIEPTPSTLSIDPRLLDPGTNVIAISVHNSSIGSSDLSFMAVLVPVEGLPDDVDCDGEPPDPVFEILRGDTNDDGGLTLSDAASLLNFLFIGGRAPACDDAADADDDGGFAINDAVLVLNYLFLGQGPPAAPGEVCGEDPTEDAFEDCASSVCETP